MTRQPGLQAARLKALKNPLIKIDTPRLRLLSLNAVQLAAYLDSPAELENSLDVGLSRSLISPVVRGAISIKLEKIKHAPESDHAWYSYWLVLLRRENFGAGLTGFKGAPDRNGCVEIGYGMDERFQNLGYTSEAAKTLLGWAFSDPRCLTVTANINQRDNIASRRVLEKIGMSVTSETDETSIWIITREQYLNNPAG